MSTLKYYHNLIIVLSFHYNYTYVPSLLQTGNGKLVVLYITGLIPEFKILRGGVFLIGPLLRYLRFSKQ